MTRTCTNCGQKFDAAPWDDELQCNLCIIDSLIEPERDSDTQPDPYIDTIAAGYQQEYESAGPRLTSTEAESIRSGWLPPSAMPKVSESMRRYHGVSA